MDKFTIEMGQFYELEDFPASHRDLLMACYHSGSCDTDVATALPFFEVDDPVALQNHLLGYGAWDANELRNDSDNLGRLLWLIAADIQEQGEAYIGS